VGIIHFRRLTSATVAARFLAASPPPPQLLDCLRHVRDGSDRTIEFPDENQVRATARRVLKAPCRAAAQVRGGRETSWTSAPRRQPGLLPRAGGYHRTFGVHKSATSNRAFIRRSTNLVAVDIDDAAFMAPAAV